MIGPMTRSGIRKVAFIAAFTVIGCAAALPAAHAQADAATEAKMQELMKMRSDRLTTELALTPDQVSQIQKINADTVGKLKELGANPSSNKKDTLNKIKTITSDRESALNKVMTPDQRKKYKDINQEDVSMLQTESMAHTLKLKADQVDKVDEINLACIKSMSAARDEKSKIKKARALRSAQDKKDEELKKVLTPEQLTAYEAMQEKPKK